MSSAPEQKQEGVKAAMLEQLRKVPIVQSACQRVGISRASYYRYRAEDEEFAQAADLAIAEGAALVNDLAESQLLTAMRDGNLTAVFYWLNHRHALYAPRLRVDATHRLAEDKLTPEQETMVEQALRLVGLKEPSDESSKD